MIYSKKSVLHIEPDTKLADLVHTDHRLLLTINRFNIPFGFRDKTIQEVCKQNQVDTACFIAIMRLLTNPENFDTQAYLHLNPAAMLGYLRNSHYYFLEKRLPDIRENLSAILENVDEISRTSILNFFDQYFKEVQEHMGYENLIVFPYIEKLLNGEPLNGFSINEFESHHSNIHEKLIDLKNIIIKYLQLPGDNYKVTNVLFDIFQSEEDINIHCYIENEILVPIVRNIENNMHLNRKNDGNC